MTKVQGGERISGAEGCGHDRRGARGGPCVDGIFMTLMVVEVT